MIIERKTIIKILKVLAFESGTGVTAYHNDVDLADLLFPDTIEKQSNSTQNRLGISFRERDVYFEFLLEEKMIEAIRSINEWRSIRLTSTGHKYLETARQESLWRRAIVGIGRILTSSFVTIVVAVGTTVLTVVILNGLGLTK